MITYVIIRAHERTYVYSLWYAFKNLTKRNPGKQSETTEWKLATLMVFEAIEQPCSNACRTSRVIHGSSVSEEDCTPPSIMEVQYWEVTTYCPVDGLRKQTIRDFIRFVLFNSLCTQFSIVNFASHVVVLTTQRLTVDTKNTRKSL